VEAANRFNEPSHTPSSFEKRSAALIVVVVFGFFVWIATRVNSGWPFTYDERLLAVTVAIVLPAVLIGTFVLVQYCYAVARVRRERRDNTP
jgi:low affinity Fe/Cu permease